MAVPTSIPLGPFTYTATGDLGKQRDTMLVNELHLRDKIGKCKTRGFYVPGKGFTYGQANEKRDYTAADALRGWSTCLPSVSATKDKHIARRDFMALNRAAVSAGLATTKEHYAYRATHDARIKESARKKFARPKKFPPDMVFGRPVRPSTPIYDLIEHKYQERWIKERRDQEIIRRQHEQKEFRSASAPCKKTNILLYDTRASLLRTYMNPIEQGPLWQMPRFTRNAQTHLDTFRSCKAREEAFENYEYDRVSRKGVNGTGVYDSAKY